MRAGLLAALTSIAVALSACAGAQRDRAVDVGYEEGEVAIEDVPVKGFSCRVRLIDRSTLEGELVSVDAIGVVILADPDRKSAVPIERSRIAAVQIRDIYDSRSGWLSAWTILGSLSTASHGLLLIFSLPVWLAAGIPVSIGAAIGNDLWFEEQKLDELRAYARFPQGIPPGWQPGQQGPPAAPIEPAPEPPGGPRTLTATGAEWSRL